MRPAAFLLGAILEDAHGFPLHIRADVFGKPLARAVSDLAAGKRAHELLVGAYEMVE